MITLNILLISWKKWDSDRDGEKHGHMNTNINQLSAH